VKPETKFYAEIKKLSKNISWIRIENLCLSGTPDLLGYNSNGNFFTVELKYTKTNKIRFSPHQIGFHLKHPQNTFILVKAGSLNLAKLYEGKNIRNLVACGFTLDPLACGLPESLLVLESLGS
jgi:hypothetical protein